MTTTPDSQGDTALARAERALRIRRATRDDFDACFAIQKAADLLAFPHIFPAERFPFPDDAVRERWRVNLDSADRACFVALDGAGIIGHAVLIGEQFDSIAVTPEWWGRGVGSVLHDAVLAHAAEKACARLQLWVLEANDRARRFYTARNWVLDGRSMKAPFPPHPTELGYARDILDFAR